MRPEIDSRISELLNQNLALLLKLVECKTAMSGGRCLCCNGPLPAGVPADCLDVIFDNIKMRHELDAAFKFAESCYSQDVLREELTAAPSSSLGPRREMSGPEFMALATYAMQEFLKLSVLGEQMWMSIPHDCLEILRQTEYARNFPSNSRPRPFWYDNEGTRARATVPKSAHDLLGILMDVRRWATVFSGMVSSAVVVERFSSGSHRDFDGSLQLMVVEYQTSKAMIPRRKCVFLRYCKKQCDGAWAVVDVSVDNAPDCPIMKCRRRPSGCLIHEQGPGISEVLWIEHVEVDNRSVPIQHRHFVSTGLAFGAKRWVEILKKHCIPGKGASRATTSRKKRRTSYRTPLLANDEHNNEKPEEPEVHEVSSN